MIEGRNTGFPNAKKALEANGSPSLRFDMNPERDYLSVTIPVHSYFSQQTEKTARELSYESRILSCLSTAPLSLTELAGKMGYKGITAKLRSTLSEMQASGKVTQIVADNAVKYSI